jgi:hypothetical protein
MHARSGTEPCSGLSCNTGNKISIEIYALQLEEESSALSKALSSGDRDLAFSVILHLRKKLSSTDFHMMIRNRFFNLRFGLQVFRLLFILELWGKFRILSTNCVIPNMDKNLGSNGT